jgi:membrane protease YdiL (CAAX protease family)
VPLGAFLVLAWRLQSRTPWHEIGYVPPKNWIGVFAIGLPFGFAFKVLMKAAVMPLFGADPVNHAYHFLSGRPDLLAVAIFSVIVAGGFGEETLYRGFLFERARKLFGPGAWKLAATVLLTAMVFASGHYADQGLTGVEQAMITGTVFGTIFAITGRIWVPMVAHASFDLTAIAMIYWNLESRVAHLVFK